jgi:hypothetical protein
VGILVLAAVLAPDPSGVGTHTQLGLPPCSAMIVWGIPCPTCGMTTAFALAVHGRLISALHAQPAGCLAAVATAALAAVSAVTVVTGRKWVLNAYRVPPGRVALLVMAAVVVAWLYRIGVTLNWF